MEAVFSFWCFTAKLRGQQNDSFECTLAAPVGLDTHHPRLTRSIRRPHCLSYYYNPGEKLQPCILIWIRSNGFASLPGCFYFNCICSFEHYKEAHTTAQSFCATKPAVD